MRYASVVVMSDRAMSSANFCCFFVRFCIAKIYHIKYLYNNGGGGNIGGVGVMADSILNRG